MCGKIIKLCSEPLLSKDHINDMRRGCTAASSGPYSSGTGWCRIPVLTCTLANFILQVCISAWATTLGTAKCLFIPKFMGRNSLENTGQLGSDVGCIIVSNPVFLRQDLSNLPIRRWLCGIWHICFKQDVSILYTHLVPAKEMTCWDKQTKLESFQDTTESSPTRYPLPTQKTMWNLPGKLTEHYKDKMSFSDIFRDI